MYLLFVVRIGLLILFVLLFLCCCSYFLFVVFVFCFMHCYYYFMCLLLLLCFLCCIVVFVFVLFVLLICFYFYCDLYCYYYSTPNTAQIGRVWDNVEPRELSVRPTCSRSSFGNPRRPPAYLPLHGEPAGGVVGPRGWAPHQPSRALAGSGRGGPSPSRATPASPPRVDEGAPPRDGPDSRTRAGTAGEGITGAPP